MWKEKQEKEIIQMQLELEKLENQILESNQELDENPDMSDQELEGFKGILEALEDLREKIESVGMSEEHRRRVEKDQEFIDRYLDKDDDES